MTYPLISIIIATYNSAATLHLTLASIKKQTYPQGKLEVLIVDGGSTDKTLELARKNSCKIIHNPKTEPVHGKCLGYQSAKGKYLIFIDADEVIKNRKSIMTKYEMMKDNPKIKAVIGSGYEDFPEASITVKYINEFGDPFSFFIYRISKNDHYFIPTMKHRYPSLVENNTTIIFDFSHAKFFPIMELGAANSMIDASYVKKTYPDFTHEIFAHLFYFLKKDPLLVGFTKNDPVIHYTSETLQKYKSKLIWRIKNNIHYSEELGKAGYVGREQFGSSVKYKKFLFIPYVYSFFFLFVDACWLAFSRKDLRYLMHIPLSLYTANHILYNYALKLLGTVPERKNYDGSKNTTV